MSTKIKFATDFWEKTQSNLQFIPLKSPDNSTEVTAVSVILIKDNKFLLTLIERGWDIPSGHVEINETPEEAVIREAYEETGAKVNSLQRIGYLYITKAQENEINKKYPDKSAIIVFASNDFDLQDDYGFIHESTEIKFCSYDSLHLFHHNWSQLTQEIINYSLIQLDTKEK
jgi:ADP-ribose pyrophosphatase YjhB (NUDIX family)